MTKEDYKNLRISRAALGRHLADLIDDLLEKEIPGDAFADTVTAVYLHILDADYRPSADSMPECDPEIFAEASMSITGSARRSAMARENARRRKAGLPPLGKSKRAKKPRRHNMVDASLEKQEEEKNSIPMGEEDDLIPMYEWQQMIKALWEKSLADGLVRVGEPMAVDQISSGRT